MLIRSMANAATGILMLATLGAWAVIATGETGSTTSPIADSGPAWGPLLNTNGGFEDGKSNYHLTRPATTEIDSDEVYRGQFSLRLQGEGAKEKTENSICVQGFAISAPTPTFTYLLRVAVKAKNVDPACPPSLVVIVGNTRGEMVFPDNGELTIGEDSDWKVLELVVSKLPDDLKTMGFWLKVPSKSQATVWFDEAEFRAGDK